MHGPWAVGRGTGQGQPRWPGCGMISLADMDHATIPVSETLAITSPKAQAPQVRAKAGSSGLTDPSAAPRGHGPPLCSSQQLLLPKQRLGGTPGVRGPHFHLPSPVTSVLSGTRWVPAQDLEFGGDPGFPSVCWSVLGQGLPPPRAEHALPGSRALRSCFRVLN